MAAARGGGSRRPDTFTAVDPPQVEILYSAVVVPKEMLPKESVSAVAGLEDELYCGTTSGSILHFGIETVVDPRTQRNSHGKHKLLHKEVSKSRGGVAKIECIRELDDAAGSSTCAGLFVLSGGAVALLRADLQTEAVISDGSRPVLDIAIAAPASGSRDSFRGLRLCALYSNKLVVYTWAGRGSMSNRQLSLPAKPLCATISAEGLITIGYSREYNIVEEQDGRVKDIDAEMPRSGQPLVAGMPQGEVIIFTNGFGLFLKPCKRDLGAGIEVDFEPSQRGILACKDAPSHVLYSYPFLSLACGGAGGRKYLDVFAFGSDMPSLQQLDLDVTTSAMSDSNAAQFRARTKGGTFDIYGNGEIRRYHSNPPFDVVQQLMSNGDLQLATDMLDLYIEDLSPELANASMLRHLQQAAILAWLRLEFRLALVYARKISMHPLELVSTMPWLLPSNASLFRGNRVELFTPDMLAKISSGSQPPSSCISIAERNEKTTQLNEFVSTGVDLRTVADIVLAKRQQTQSTSRSGPSVRSKKGRIEDTNFAWGTFKSNRMSPYLWEDELWECETKVGAQISSPQSIQIAQVSFIEHAMQWLETNGQDADPSVAIVHFAVVKAIVDMHDYFESFPKKLGVPPSLSKALRMCRSPLDGEIEACLVHDTHKLLLAEFQIHRGKLESALGSCEKLNSMDSGVLACEALGKCEDESLFKRYSPWLLKLNVDLGLQALMQFVRKQRTSADVIIRIVRDSGLPDIKPGKDSALIRVLMWLVKDEKEIGEHVHTLFGRLMIEAVKVSRIDDWSPFDMPPVDFLDTANLEDQCRTVLQKLANSKFNENKIRCVPGCEPGELGILRGRLIRFLRYRGCKADALALLPLCQKSMFEERIELLGLLGRHSDAICIAVASMHDFRAAEDYCSRRHDSPSGDPLTNYLQILQTETSGPGTWRAYLLSNMLTKYASRLSSAEVVNFVHDTRSVASVEQYVSQAVPSLFSSGREQYFSRQVSSLARVEQRESLARGERRGVVLTRSSQCAITGKRIGDAAFRLSNDLKPVLLSEFRRVHQDKLAKGTRYG